MINSWKFVACDTFMRWQKLFKKVHGKYHHDIVGKVDINGWNSGSIYYL